ncbi:MAG: tetratricopeptide repeat protein [Bradymonadia bacterium]
MRKVLGQCTMVAVMVLGTGGVASACAMYRPKMVEAPESVVAKAEAASKRGDARKAIQLFERAMNDERAETGVRVSAAVRAAQLHLAAKHTRQGQRRFEHALALDENHAPAMLGLARLHVKAKNTDAARALVLRAEALPNLSPAERAEFAALRATVSPPPTASALALAPVAPAPAPVE